MRTASKGPARLSRAEAAELQRAYHERGDLRARERLIEAYLPLVRSLARRLAYREERFEDLVQVGAIGLIKAVDRFDPARGVGFGAFAKPNIFGEMQRHLRDKSGLIRLPRRHQETSLPTLSLAEVEPLHGDDVLGSSDDRVTVARGLGRLHRRERQAVRCRYFADMSQSEIAARLGISRTQTSRLLASGLEKLRADLGSDADFSASRQVNSFHGDSGRRQGRAA
jgi:RNA polymerase sigma-B factor